MYKEEITHYSECLSREMHIMVYGHDGIPFLAFPTQDSLCHNYEDFGMIGELSGYLEAGKIRYFVVDTIDKESWSEGDPDLGRRAWKQELYFRYIVDEVMPIILERTGGMLPMTTGCSLGANHAVLTLLRRPDLFSGCVALSGLYDSKYFFNGWVPGKRTVSALSVISRVFSARKASTHGVISGAMMSTTTGPGGSNRCTISFRSFLRDGGFNKS